MCNKRIPNFDVFICYRDGQIRYANQSALNPKAMEVNKILANEKLYRKESDGKFTEIPEEEILKSGKYYLEDDIFAMSCGEITIGSSKTQEGLIEKCIPILQAKQKNENRDLDTLRIFRLDGLPIEKHIHHASLQEANKLKEYIFGY